MLTSTQSIHSPLNSAGKLQVFRLRRGRYMNIHPAEMTPNKGTLYNGRRLCKLWVELLRQSCSLALTLLTGRRTAKTYEHYNTAED